MSPQQLGLFDRPKAQERKRAMLDQVEENAGTWMSDILSAARDFAADHRGMTVTGETIRQAIEPVAGAPHHHNAWGAAITQMIRRGYLVPTGRWVAMTGAKSNARKTPQYMLVRV